MNILCRSTYFDGLFNEEDNNQHAKEFISNSCKSTDDIASIEYCKKKKENGSPNTNPVDI